MSLLEDIKKQPRHVREIMFAFCVVITISLSGFIWFRSFEKNLFVMMNTDQADRDKFFAERAKNNPALLAGISDSYQNVRAAISGFFLLTDGEDNDKNKTDKKEEANIESKEKIYMFPVVR